jgi:hypothetical protein
MKWVFENLQLILVIAGAIAYWLNQRAREKAGEDADYDGDGLPENRPARRELTPANRDGSDPDQEERARQIREEIRRKIAERRGQVAPAPEAPPPLPRFDPFRPVFQEDAAPVPPPLRPAEPETVREVVVVQADSSALERQRQLAEQLEQLEAQRREASRQAARLQEERDRARAHSADRSASPPAGAVLGSRSVAAELRDPRALRRAFVLREVLSAPVALR